MSVLRHGLKARVTIAAERKYEKQTPDCDGTGFGGHACLDGGCAGPRDTTSDSADNPRRAGPRARGTGAGGAGAASTQGDHGSVALWMKTSWPHQVRALWYRPTKCTANVHAPVYLLYIQCMVLDLSTLVADLRAAGGDVTSVEVKSAAGGLPESLASTLSALANLPGGGTIILGLDERAGFRPVHLSDPPDPQTGARGEGAQPHTSGVTHDH